MKPEDSSGRAGRLKAVQKSSAVAAILFTSASSVRWLGNFFYNFETGPSPFHLLPSALLFVADQPMCMIIADNEAIPEDPGPEMIFRSYSSYVYEKPLDPAGKFTGKLDETLKEYGLTSARIGVEPGSFPLALRESIKAAYPRISFTDMSAEIARIKAVKDPDEILCIRRATALCDTGQEAVLKYTADGMSEIRLFCLARMEIEMSAGTRVPIMADLVSGPRTVTGGGVPSARIINVADPVLCDLTPCLNGYWGDSCNTIIVGQPGSDHRNTFRRVKDALDAAIDAIRPGVKACEIDGILRKYAGDFPHHGGHGIGTVYHEEPRITPYNQMELAPGMVIALEPAIYKENYGLRLEHVVAVTEDGCEILTQFMHRLS